MHWIPGHIATVRAGTSRAVSAPPCCDSTHRFKRSAPWQFLFRLSRNTAAVHVPLKSPEYTRRCVPCRNSKHAFIQRLRAAAKKYSGLFITYVARISRLGQTTVECRKRHHPASRRQRSHCQRPELLTSDVEWVGCESSLSHLRAEELETNLLVSVE